MAQYQTPEGYLNEVGGLEYSTPGGYVNETGATLYYVLYPSAGAAPSAIQVKAGQDATGAAALVSGSEPARTTTGTQTFATPASGLAASTSYRLAFVWSGATDSAVSVSDAWSTLSAGGATTVNQATETDTAQPVGKAKYKSFGQATTTDAAQAITAARGVAIGQVVETDSAQAVGSQKVQALGQATETDTAQPITKSGVITVAVGQAAESDSAQAFAVSKTVSIGMVTESEFAQAVAAYKRLGILQPVETDSAHAIAAIKHVGVGQAIEADTAQPIYPPIELSPHIVASGALVRHLIESAISTHVNAATLIRH